MGPENGEKQQRLLMLLLRSSSSSAKATIAIVIIMMVDRAKVKAVKDTMMKLQRGDDEDK